MKKLIYAVMLLLGLSMVNTSCDNSIEGTAKRDAKRYVDALVDEDEEAISKANKLTDMHAHSCGDYDRYKEAFAKYAGEYLDEAMK